MVKRRICHKATFATKKSYLYTREKIKKSVWDKK